MRLLTPESPDISRLLTTRATDYCLENTGKEDKLPNLFPGKSYQQHLVFESGLDPDRELRKSGT